VTKKATKTEAELKKLLMQEIRRHPAFRHIQGVAITRPIQHAPHHPNWGFCRQVEGRGAIPNIPPKANRKWKNRPATDPLA
jgi:hypothetical protein